MYTQRQQFAEWKTLIVGRWINNTEKKLKTEMKRMGKKEMREPKIYMYIWECERARALTPSRTIEKKKNERKNYRYNYKRMHT